MLTGKYEREVMDKNDILKLPNTRSDWSVYICIFFPIWRGLFLVDLGEK